MTVHGRVHKASSGDLGRPGVYFRSLKFDFRPKLRHSILDASLIRVFTSFSLFFRVFCTDEKALRYYRCTILEPCSDCDTKLFHHVILRPTCPHGAFQNPPKSSLESILVPSRGLLGWAKRWPDGFQEDMKRDGFSKPEKSDSRTPGRGRPLEFLGSARGAVGRSLCQ